MSRHARRIRSTLTLLHWFWKHSYFSRIGLGLFLTWLISCLKCQPLSETIPSWKRSMLESKINRNYFLIFARMRKKKRSEYSSVWKCKFIVLNYQLKNHTDKQKAISSNGKLLKTPWKFYLKKRKHSWNLQSNQYHESSEPKTFLNFFLPSWNKSSVVIS